MRIEDLDTRSRELTEDAANGMKEWRLEHPKATFHEIEAALDERPARIRARMLEDAALMRRKAELETDAVGERLACPDCGTPLKVRGQ